MNSLTAPKKSGKYTVRYRRSKSQDEAFGTAVYRLRAYGGHEQGWSEIINQFTGRPVLPSFDTRDLLIRFPTVVAWSQ